MIPKDILNYGYDEAKWMRYPGAKGYASELLRHKAPRYFYSYPEDSCFRVSHGIFYRKNRGEQPENIDKTKKTVLIEETQITGDGFDKLTSEKKTVEISKEEYDKFSNTFTPWNKSLLRMLFDECTEDPGNINHITLGSLFYDDAAPPIEVINDARQILGLSPIRPNKS